MLDHAQDLAGDTTVDSGHILLALLIDDNRAKAVLEERGVGLEKLSEVVRRLQEADAEPLDTVPVVHLKTVQFAESVGAELAGTLHLLAGIARVPRGVAYQALEALGIRPVELRNAVMRVVSGNMPKQWMAPSAVPHADRVRPPRTAVPESRVAVVEPPQPEAEGPRADAGRSLPVGFSAPPTGSPGPASKPHDRLTPPSGAPRPPAPSAEPPRGVAPSGAGSRAPDSARPAVDSDGLLVSPAARQPGALTPGPTSRAPSPPSPRAPVPSGARPKVDAARPERRPRFALDEETFPTLTRLGRNLTLLAERGELDPLVGREREVEQLVDILNKRRSNNPCLLGEPGVGKTALVEGLAQLIVRKASQVGALGEKILVELDMGTLVAGTQLRGAFSERLRAIKEEVASAAGRVILFIDELHTLIGAGSGDGALDAANELKTALARGELPCIGSTTEREYRRYVEADAALARRFQVVLVDEPSPEEALVVLQGVAPTYAAHHRVTYSAEALDAAVRLTGRWIFDRFLPSKAIDVLDLAGAHAARNGRPEVRPEDVARVVALKAGVPEARLLETEPRRLLKLSEHLRSRVIAHDAAMDRVAAVIRRNAAGFVSHRPMGSFLLLGPTGVGKTECARVLAEFLFGSREALTRIDMSEHMDAHSVSRLIGAPPGYVGHEDGGQLTEAVRRRPYQIVVFDEVEKAAPEVLNLLLQLLEEGMLTDGRGRKVRFRNTVVLLTSNLGQAEFDPKARTLGFGGGEAPTDRSARALKAAERGFSPELWNRIEDKLVFSPLDQEAVRRIARLLVDDSAARIQRERGLTYSVTPEVIDFLVERGFDARLGARPLRRVLQHLVENAIADALLEDDLAPGVALLVQVEDGALAVRAISNEK